MENEVIHICADYSPEDGSVSNVVMLMTIETEGLGNWHPGDLVKINADEYVLGARAINKKTRTVTYELLVKVPVLHFPIPPLSME